MTQEISIDLGAQFRTNLFEKPPYITRTSEAGVQAFAHAKSIPFTELSNRDFVEAIIHLEWGMINLTMTCSLEGPPHRFCARRI